MRASGSGSTIVVLRLLEGEVPFETPVTYLAELMRGNAAPLLAPWVKPLADDPLRLPYRVPAAPTLISRRRRAT